MKIVLMLGLALLTASLSHGEAPAAAAAAAGVPETDAGWPAAYFEIFRLAPGQHEAFIREIARADEIAAAGGQPPIQMYVHDGGADWDVLLLKPTGAPKPSPEQQAAMDAKARELHFETGPAYFVNLRKYVASHSDTKALGPLRAADWLARLEAWRANHKRGR